MSTFIGLKINKETKETKQKVENKATKQKVEKE